MTNSKLTTEKELELTQKALMRVAVDSEKKDKEIARLEGIIEEELGENH